MSGSPNKAEIWEIQMEKQIKEYEKYISNITLKDEGETKISLVLD